MPQISKIPPRNAEYYLAHNALVEACKIRGFGEDLKLKTEESEILQSDLNLIRAAIKSAAETIYFEPANLQLWREDPFTHESAWVPLNGGKGFLVMPGGYTSTGTSVYMKNPSLSESTTPVLWEHFDDLAKLIQSLVTRKYDYHVRINIDKKQMHTSVIFPKAELSGETHNRKYDPKLKIDEWEIQYKVLPIGDENSCSYGLYYHNIKCLDNELSWRSIPIPKPKEGKIDALGLIRDILITDPKVEGWQDICHIQPVVHFYKPVTIEKPGCLTDEDQNGVVKSGCGACCDLFPNPFQMLASILAGFSSRIKIPLALSWGDCNNLQTAHFMAVYDYAGHTWGQYNCDTFVERRHYGGGTDANGGSAQWQFWYVRRPSGALVPFILNYATNIGEPSADYRKHGYKLKDLGAYQEVQFNDGISQVMNTSKTLYCKPTNGNAPDKNNIPGIGVEGPSGGNPYLFVTGLGSKTLLYVDQYAVPTGTSYNAITIFSSLAAGAASNGVAVTGGAWTLAQSDTASTMSLSATSSAMPEYDRIARIEIDFDAAAASGAGYSAFFPGGGAPTGGNFEQGVIMEFYNTLEQPIGQYIENQFESGLTLRGYWHRYGTELQPAQLTVFERSTDEDENIHELQNIIRFDGEGDRSETSHYVVKHLFPFGEEIIREYSEYGTDDEREAVYEYDDDPDSGGYGQLRFRRDFNGAWKRYEYDIHGRLTKEIESVGDLPDSAPEDQCKVTVYDYTPLHEDEIEDPADSRPRTVITYNQGVEVDRQYHVYFEQENWDIETTEPGAEWDDESNLVTKYYRGTEGDFMGRPSETVNPDGSRTVISYTKHNIENPGTDAETYDLETVTESGHLPDHGTREVTMRNAAGNLLWRRTYDIATGLLTGGSDYTYDDFGRVIGETTVDADTTATVYNCCGPRFVTAPDSSVTEYGYDVFNRRVLTVASGLATVQKYDAGDNVTESTLIGKEDGELVTRYEYDADGRLIRETNPSGAVTTYKYGENWTETTNPLGYVQVSEYYPDGRLRAINGNAVYPRTYKYGVENGELYTLECAAGEPLSRTYTDHRGRQYKTVYPDGFTELTIYDKFSRVIRQENSKGAKTLYLYDEATGKLKYQVIKVLDSSNEIDWENDIILEYESGYTEKDGTVISYQKVYKHSDNVKKLISSEEISRDGKKSWITRDGKTTYTEKKITGIATVEETTVNSDGTSLTNETVDGNLMRSIDSVLGVTEYIYDEFNRSLSSSHEFNGVNSRSEKELDKMGRVLKITQSVGQEKRTVQYSYDLLGRKISEISSEGIKNSYIYNSHSRVIGTRGATYHHEYQYNNQGQIVYQVTYQDENTPQVTSFVYNNRGWMIEKFYADNTRERYSYYENGKIHQYINARGHLHTFDYNLAGELTRIYSNVGLDRTYEYNQLEQIVRISDHLGDFEFEYDNYGKLLAEIFPDGTRVHQDYDHLQRVSSIGLNNITMASFRYGIDGRISSISNGSAEMIYNYLPGTNMIASSEWQNGENIPFLTINKEYDHFARLIGIDANNQPIVGYTLNNDNQHTSAEITGNTKWQYGYDELSQLSEAVRKDIADNEINSMSYTYDGIGNRIYSNEDGAERNYLVNLLNQYTQIEEETCSYDLDGNMLKNRGWQYTWNTENRLIKAEKGDIRIEADYDYRGRRAYKKVYENDILIKHEKYVYLDYKLIAIYDGLNDDVLLKTFVWQPSTVSQDIPVCISEGSNIYYYVADGNKNIAGLFDNLGTKVSSYIYGPFGQILSSNGVSAETNPFRFSSEYHDDETGLVYYNYRYYDSEIGRWTKRDPIGETGNSNLYEFLKNDSISTFDKLGLIWGFGEFKAFAGSLFESAKDFSKEMISGSKAMFDGMAWRQLQSDISDTYTERILMQMEAGASLDDAIPGSTGVGMVLADFTGMTQITEAWEGLSLTNGGSLDGLSRIQNALQGGGQALLVTAGISSAGTGLSGQNGLGLGQKLLRTTPRNGLLRNIAACRAKVWHNNSVVVYRGVNSKNVAFNNAARGIVSPNRILPGGATPFMHNNVSTLNSPFTSWSTDMKVAVNYASRGGGFRGAILTYRVQKSLIIESPNRWDVSHLGKSFSESEVLLRDTIKVSQDSVTIINID